MPEYLNEVLPEEARRHLEAAIAALTRVVGDDGTERFDLLDASQESFQAAKVVAVQASVIRQKAEGEEKILSFPRIVARRLKGHRKDADLTQADLAAAMQRCGFDKWTRVTVAETEAGSRKVSLEELLALAGLYSVPLVDFLVPHELEAVRHNLGVMKSSDFHAMVVGPSDGPGWGPAVQLTLDDAGEDWRPARPLWDNRRKHLGDTVGSGSEA